MDKELSKIREIVNLAESNSAIDRRKFLQEMQEIYGYEDYIAAITNQTIHDFNSSTSWNQIMLSIHRVALLEAEKVSIKKSVRTPQINYSAGLMLQTVSLATSTEDLSLCFDDLMAALLTVWSNKTYKFYKDTYMNIFINNVLQKDIYRCNITGKQWREILRYSIIMYPESSDTFKSDLLNAMNLIVKFGSTQSHLVIDVTNNLLPFLVKVYRELRGTEKEFMLKQLYKLTSSVCLEIGTESPLALSDFTMKCITPIIRYDGCSEMYKMLLILMKMQRPNGIAINNSDNEDDWSEIIQTIYGIIERNIREEKLTSSFLKLCCEVYREILENPKNLVDDSSNFSTSSKPPKMQRLSVEKVDDPIDTFLLNKNTVQANWPFIQILTVLLRKYPEILRKFDYTEFLKNIAKLMKQTAENDEAILANLCELTTIVVIKIDDNVGNQQVEKILHQIWETIVRQLGMNKNQLSCHELLRSLIYRGYSLNPQVFLRLYLKRSINWSASSIETLSTYCRCVSLRSGDSKNSEDQETATRELLLQWCLDIPKSHRSLDIPIESLSNLLTILATKSSRIQEFHNFLTTSNENDENFDETSENENSDNWDTKKMRKIEKSLLSLVFRVDIFDDPENIVVDDKILPKYEILEDPFNLLIDSLNDELTKISDNQNTPETPINRKIVILTIISKILSNLNDLKIDSSKLTKLVEIFFTIFENILSSLTNREDETKREKSEIFESLNIFYTTKYNKYLNDRIIEITFKENFLSHILKQSFDKKCEDQSISKYSDAVIINLCCVDSGPEIICEQIKLAKNFIKIIDSCRCVDKKNGCTERFVKLLTKLSSSEKPKNCEYLETIVESMRKIFQISYKYENILSTLLKLMPKFLKIGENNSSIMKILTKIDDIANLENFGPSIIVEFVKALGKIIQSNPREKWKSDKFVIDYFVDKISHQFYVVRLEAVRQINFIFSLKQFDVDWKMKYFEKILASMKHIFEANDSRDQLESKKISSLYVLSAILRDRDDSRELQYLALSSIIDLSIEKQIEPSKIRKALIISSNKNEDKISWSRKLIERNLYKLLKNWIDEKNSLKRFPWILTDSSSYKNFVNNYIDIIVRIKLQRNEFNDIQNLCDDADLSFTKIIENSFSSIYGQLITSKNLREIHKNLRDNKNEFSKIRSFDYLIADRLSDVIVDIFGRFYDHQNYLQIFNELKYESDFLPIQPTIDVETIGNSFAELETDLKIDKSIIEYLVANRPSVLQKILLKLLDNIDDSFNGFHQYIYFYDLVIGKLSEDYFDDMANFVIRDLTYSLLNFIVESKKIGKIGCKYFVKLIDRCLPKRVDEIERLFDDIVSTLVPLADKISGVLPILRSLIIDRKNYFSASIVKLDKFPNTQIFEDMKNLQNRLKYRDETIDIDLEMEIIHFLNATNDKKICSYEGLVDLRKQLSTRSDELVKLYRKIEESRGFSEDCATSILHKLIVKLVDLTKSNKIDISVESAKCLGELGPADLTTIILNPDKSYQTGDIEDFTIEIIEKLSIFITDSDTNLRKKSCDGLIYLLSTDWTDKFFRKITKKHFLHQNIYPFLTDIKKIRTNKSIDIDTEKFRIFVESKNLWIPVKILDYPKWIVEITSKILDCFVNFYTISLKSVSLLSVEFSTFLFPRLIDILIKTDDRIIHRLCKCIDTFFGHLFEDMKNICGNERDKNDDSSKSHECIRCMINVANCVRINSIESNEIIDINYLYIANAADYSSAYFTSLLYAELSCRRILLENSVKDDFGKLTASWISSIDLICDFDPNSGQLLQHIVREACLHIGDPDSIYGCGLSHLINSSYRAQHYIHLKQWNKVMLEQDMQLNQSETAANARRDMLNALQQSGHQSLAGLLIKFTSNKEIGDTDPDEDLTYETAWRLTDWSQLELPSPTVNTTKIASTIFDNKQNATQTFNDNYESQDYHYSRNHYRALEHLRDKNLESLASTLIEARTSIVESLRNTNLECSQTIYPMLSKLQMLREIEEFGSFDVSQTEDIRVLINDWNNQDFSNSHDFKYIEPILSQRLSLYQIRNESDERMKQEIINTQLKISRTAEKQGFLSAASRALNTLAENENLSDIAKHHLIYHKALLAWKEDQRDIGRYLLRDFIKKPTLDTHLRAKVLRICGNWMAESKCENPQMIINNYYEESIDTSKSLNDINALTDAQADLGQFADFQYQQIMRFTKSTRYENLPEMSQQTSSKNRRKSSIIDNDDETQEAHNAYRQLVTNDVSALEDINREKDLYLMLAANNYLMTLQNSTNHDVLIFRLMSLWLENTLNVDLNKILDDNLSRIASHKFIILMCQVAPHMSNVASIFTTKINDLMERCAIEHPHHALPVLLALKNTYKDEDFNGTDKKKTTKRQRENRVIATDALVAKLSRHPKLRSIIQEISQLSEALIMLAYYSSSPTAQAKKTGVAHNIPRTQAITKIRNFENTTVPTITMSVNPSGKYENIIGIQEYETKYKIPGGVNAPKIVVCIGTDGVQRRELVKGQDDLRQDAVMQQVCTVVNSMLKSSRETKRRRLHIRTYKIVPLSRRSGVLEWCENTLPISHVLTDVDGIPGVHTKYYPNDWNVKKCYATLSAAKSSSRSEKLAVFLECCKNLHPAFHHFFMEKYPSAETWFERRLAYVRSVATTSMVGYILGLGDRHFSNILIDQTTAEVIHIDFGIAFAQGKVLPIPETVPFRLTRDLEVAMGICGVEGVFRRSCEETLNVLRERRETLITVLQVLLYDPLFSWSITPMEKTDYHVHTQGDEKKTNEIAEKALLKIDEKLQGRSADGLILSISGQVERLIQQARDPANLCRIYCGWQPYL